MIPKCLIQREMPKKESAADGGFRRKRRFRRRSLINIMKATAIPKLTAVTHFWPNSCVSFNGFSPLIYNFVMKGNLT